MTPVLAKAVVLGLLSGLPAYHGDGETDEARRTRLDSPAEAIVEVARTSDDVVALVALAEAESRLAAHVHQGRCRPWECDGGLARGLWQNHEGSVAPAVWFVLATPGPLADRVGAREALRVWRSALGWCHGDLACARARYRGTSRITEHEQAFARRFGELRRRIASDFWRRRARRVRRKVVAMTAKGDTHNAR